MTVPLSKNLECHKVDKWIDIKSTGFQKKQHGNATILVINLTVMIFGQSLYTPMSFYFPAFYNATPSLYLSLSASLLNDVQLYF